jgi:hypothetical protein
MMKYHIIPETNCHVLFLSGLSQVRLAGVVYVVYVVPCVAPDGASLYAGGDGRDEMRRGHTRKEQHKQKERPSCSRTPERSLDRLAKVR